MEDERILNQSVTEYPGGSWQFDRSQDPQKDNSNDNGSPALRSSGSQWEDPLRENVPPAFSIELSEFNVRIRGAVRRQNGPTAARHHRY